MKKLVTVFAVFAALSIGQVSAACAITPAATSSHSFSALFGPVAPLAIPFVALAVSDKYDPNNFKTVKVRCVGCGFDGVKDQPVNEYLANKDRYILVK